MRNFPLSHTFDGLRADVWHSAIDLHLMGEYTIARKIRLVDTVIPYLLAGVHTRLFQNILLYYWIIPSLVPMWALLACRKQAVNVMKRVILFGFTHTLMLIFGFALGVYFLPILTAPSSPSQAVLEEQSRDAMFVAELTRDLRGSDFLHWGEGRISISATRIVHEGKLAPVPDYKLYLLDRFVEHEDEFLPIKASAVLIGDVKTFNGVSLPVPDGIDVTQYSTVLVWCEAFSEFITAATYQ